MDVAVAEGFDNGSEGFGNLGAVIALGGDVGVTTFDRIARPAEGFNELFVEGLCDRFALLGINGGTTTAIAFEASGDMEVSSGSGIPAPCISASYSLTRSIQLSSALTLYQVSNSGPYPRHWTKYSTISPWPRPVRLTRLLRSLSTT